MLCKNFGNQEFVIPNHTPPCRCTFSSNRGVGLRTRHGMEKTDHLLQERLPSLRGAGNASSFPSNSLCTRALTASLSIFAWEQKRDPFLLPAHTPTQSMANLIFRGTFTTGPKIQDRRRTDFVAWLLRSSLVANWGAFAVKIQTIHSALHRYTQRMATWNCNLCGAL